MRKHLALRAVGPLLVLLLPLSSRAADAEATLEATPREAIGDGGAVNGLYPLWEQTAVLHPLGGFQLGYQHAQVGLGRVQLGTQPILDLHGSPNLELKLAVWRGQRFSVALVVGGFYLPTAAESRTLGNLHPSGFTNPFAPVWLCPISLAKTLRLGSRVAVHWASTLLVSGSSDPQHRYVSGGQTLMMEVAAGPHWSAQVHGGAEGWPVQPVAHAGLSIAYRGEHLYGGLGAGRRFSFEGESANQILFDAGLLFR
jgi:hypothetical protein